VVSSSLLSTSLCGRDNPGFLMIRVRKWLHRVLSILSKGPMIIRTGLRTEAAQRVSTNSQLQNVTEVSIGITTNFPEGQGSQILHSPNRYIVHIVAYKVE